MKMWIGLMDTSFTAGDDITSLSDYEGTLFSSKTEAEMWASSEGDIFLEVEVTSAKVMESQLRAVVVYSATKPITKKGKK